MLDGQDIDQLGHLINLIEDRIGVARHDQSPTIRIFR